MSTRGIGAITNIGSNILLSTKKNIFFGKKNPWKDINTHNCLTSYWYTYQIVIYNHPNIHFMK